MELQQPPPTSHQRRTEKPECASAHQVKMGVEGWRASASGEEPMGTTSEFAFLSLKFAA